MTYLAAISQENLEKAMLISLIVVLGVILYMKLIRNLKRKRLNESYASISGYDVVNGELELRYSLPSALQSEFIFKSKEQRTLFTTPINHEEAGSYSAKVNVNELEDDIIYVHLATAKQILSKKIYLTKEE